MKLLASDFDRTLYFKDEETGFFQHDIKAINTFQKKGNKFGICTGRPLVGITDFLVEGLRYDFYIINSGAYILDDQLQTIFQKHISYETVKEVLESYPHIQTKIMTTDFIYAKNDAREFPSPVFRQLENITDLKNQTILGFSFRLDDEEKADQLVKELHNYTEIEAYQNCGDIDCVAKGCSKQSGIDIIQDYYKADDDDVACIGDSYNDIPMLQGVKHSYTFNNSPVTVKNTAAYTVDSLAECIEDLLSK